MRSASCLLLSTAVVLSSSEIAAAHPASDATDAHLSVDALSGMSPDSVQDLLETWNLKKAFGAAFDSISIDGESLVHTNPSELREALASSDPDFSVSDFNFQRLTRRLSPVWAEHEKRFNNNNAMNKNEFESRQKQSQRRSLSSSSDGVAGVEIAGDNAFVQFGDDCAVRRSGESSLVLDSSLVNVTDDLHVEGDIVNEAFTGVVEDVSALLDAVGDLDGDVEELQADAATLYSAVESAYGEAALGMSRSNPAKSCRYILQMGGDAHNGHYWITRDGDEAPFLAYCDMGRGGLELVFKLVAGAGGSALDLWEDTDNHVLYNETSDMNPFASDNHYISPRLVSSWDSAGTKMNTVYASMLIGQREEARATFSADGTDYMSWFADDYLIDSSWDDIMTTDKNYFAIEGHEAASRYFYMNANYGGCGSDAGWWVVTGRTSGCDWEIQNDQPTILYSPYGTKSAADGGIDGWQQADSFVIAVDYDAVYDSCRAALQESGYRARDGQYWIDHDGNTDPQLVYCDMEHGGYEMVFKLVTGGVTSPKMFGGDAGDDDGYSQGCDLWTDSDRDWPSAAGRNVDIHDEEGDYGAGEHYLSAFRHNAFSDTDIVVDHIEVRVITAEKTVKYFHFSGMNDEEYDDWFNLDYLHTASYTDMFDDDGYNYFSIEGHATAGRCFFANANYGGCSVDAGWVVVAARDQEGCSWEDKHYYPDVMYSTGSTSSTADSYDLADMLAVFYYWHSE